MANGDDLHDRYPLPHERLVPVAELDALRAENARLVEATRRELARQSEVWRQACDEARAIARRAVSELRLWLREYGSENDIETIDVLADFNALPWAKES